MSKDDVLKRIQQGQLHVPTWQNPVRFGEIETPAISANFLPPVLRDFVVALAEETETPVELAMGCVLGVCSTALTGKVVANPKQGWVESVNTYWSIELPPANLKSAVFKACTAPLKQWEADQNKLLSPIIEKAESKRKSQEQYIERLRKNAASADVDTQRDFLYQKIDKLVSELEKPPVRIKLFANNVTPEALENFTYQQGGNFAVLSDEGGVLETLTGLYSNSRANVDLILKGIDGGDIRIGRKDRDVEMNPYLTFVLCVQPRIREKMARNPALIGNGALERFLYLLPKSRIGYRTHNTQPMPESVKMRYNAVIRQLLDIQMIDNGNGVKSPHRLTLSRDAFNMLQQFKLWLEPQIRENGSLNFCQGWAGKVAGYAVRIAATMHAVEYGVQATEISASTMHNALEIAARLIEHARVAFMLMGMDEKIHHAKRIYEWILSEGKSQFTQTELTLAMKHHIKASQIRRAVEELEERHILKSISKEGNGTKNTTTHFANPQLFSASQAGILENSVSSVQLTQFTEVTREG